MIFHVLLIQSFFNNNIFSRQALFCRNLVQITTHFFFKELKCNRKQEICLESSDSGEKPGQSRYQIVKQQAG